MNRRLPLVLSALLLQVMLSGSILAQQGDPPVTTAQFRQLQWLHGTWLGSGGAYPAFYEEYRFLNDSTIRMRAFSDSTFQTATDSSLIELRAGRITKSRGGRTQHAAIVFAADRIQFRAPGATAGGFTFARRSNDLWTATLHPAVAGRPETVYTMRRLSP